MYYMSRLSWNWTVCKQKCIVTTCYVSPLEKLSVSLPERASKPFSLSLSRLLKVLCRSVNARHFSAQMALLADCDKKGLIKLIVENGGLSWEKGKLKLNCLCDLVEVKFLLSLSLVVIIGLFSGRWDYEDFKSPPNIMIKIFPPSGNMAERLSSLSSSARILYCHKIIWWVTPSCKQSVADWLFISLILQRFSWHFNITLLKTFKYFLQVI